MRLSVYLLHRPSPVSDRLLSAALFGGAAGLLALGLWPLLWGDIVAFGAAAGVPAAAVVGALAAPRLAANAARSAGPARACWDGAAVAIWAYLLGALAFALALAVSARPGSGSFVGSFALSLLLSLVYGAVALAPALAFGAVAGWLFYKWRSGALPAGAV